MSDMLDCTDPANRSDSIAAAARAVQGGSVIVLPTDTLYGIGVDAFNSTAVGELLAAKGRGRDMPVPVLVGSWSTIDGLVSYVSSAARDLIEAFWPGGLTLIVEHAPSLAWDLGDARGTVGIRMPLHPVALELLAATGPMAVSSANRTGMRRVGGDLPRQWRRPDRQSVHDCRPDRRGPEVGTGRRSSASGHSRSRPKLDLRRSGNLRRCASR
jgi:tRNA threonylcarbamoyl adenosine modification protein (Sua5/YciO/YrdC/YwlC family)